MNEDRPWDGEEPSGRPDLSFPALPTAIAVFLAVGAPIVFTGIALGVRQAGTPRTSLIVAGVVIAAAVAVWTFAALRRR